MQYTCMPFARCLYNMQYMLSESPCIFAVDFRKHTHEHMLLLMQIFQLTPQQILVGLFAMVGILVFTIACWRNIHSNDN